MPNLDAVVAAIRGAHRRRVFAMETRKRNDLALGAYLRIQLGFRIVRDDDEMTPAQKKAVAATNEAAKTAAQAIIDMAERVAEADRLAEVNRNIERDNLIRVENGEKPRATKLIVVPDTSAVPHWDEHGFVAVASIKARQPAADLEAGALKEMESLVKTLPVWEEFGEPICGFGPASMGQIIAEVGNMSAYDNPGKVWKRMGLAPVIGNDGLHHHPSRLKSGDLTKAEWRALGYSRRRRSVMFVIAESLLKQQNEYRDLWMERRAFEHKKAEANLLVPATTVKATVESWEKAGLPPLALVKKIDPDVHMSAAHMNARARVYVEKRLLRQMWKAWRKIEGLSHESRWDEVEVERKAA